MATVNIPSYCDDPNYRYKMPMVIVKTVGRGNGIRTNIMNMGDIARALKRSPDYCTRFCGCELGASSQYKAGQGFAFVNGVHTDLDVLAVLDKFVEKFVLCPHCRLPEVDLLVRERRVCGVCNACGFDGVMDNAHKVAVYICKNPPETANSTVRKGEPAEKSKSRRSAKAVDVEELDADEEQCINLNQCNQRVVCPNEEKREARERNRRERLEKQAESSKGLHALLAQLEARIEEKGKKSEALSASLREDLTTGKISHFEFAYLSMALLFSGGAVTGDELAKCGDRVKAALAGLDQRSILKVWEALGLDLHQEVFENYKFVCHWLYTEDLVDEDEFLRRYSALKSVSSKKAAEDRTRLGRSRGAQGAAQFIEWLQVADSPSE